MIFVEICRGRVVSIVFGVKERILWVLLVSGFKFQRNDL